MVVAENASPRTVARTVTPALHRLAVLVGVLALIAILGVVLSTRAVDDLTEGLQPASVANQSVLQDLTDLESAVGAWARSGDPGALDDYQQALARLPGHQQVVEQYAADDARLLGLVQQQRAAAERWLDDYAQPRVRAPGGAETFRMARYRNGQRLFEQVRAAHQETAELFGSRVREASADATWRLRATIGSVALLTLLGWLVVGRSRARLRSRRWPSRLCLRSRAARGRFGLFLCFWLFFLFWLFLLLVFWLFLLLFFLLFFLLFLIFVSFPFSFFSFCCCCCCCCCFLG